MGIIKKIDVVKGTDEIEMGEIYTGTDSHGSNSIFFGGNKEAIRLDIGSKEIYVNDKELYEDRAKGLRKITDKVKIIVEE